MKIANVMSQLKTFLEGLEWTSDSGSGTSSFNAVYDYENYYNSDGSPFVVILDNNAVGSWLDFKNYQVDTTITIDLVVNWSQMESATDDDAKREEAVLRLREAWDYLKTQLYLVTTWTSLGADIGFDPGYTTEFDNESNLVIRKCNLTVKEIVNG